MRLGTRQQNVLAIICLAVAVPAVAATSCLLSGTFTTGRMPGNAERKRAVPDPWELAEPTVVFPLEPSQPPGLEPSCRRAAAGAAPLPMDRAARVIPADYLAEVRQQNRELSAARPSEHPAVPDGVDVQQAPHDSQGETDLRFLTPEPSARQGAFPSTPQQPLRSDATVRIPLSSSVPAGAVRTDPQTGLVSIAVRGVPLNDVLGLLAQQQGLNVIAGEDITARISITLGNVPFEQAMTQILSVAGYTWIQQGDVILVTSVATGKRLAPHVQGREVRVFPLDYVSATDVDLVIKGLLSPVGQSFPTESSNGETRKTQEVVVVDDLPAYLGRVEQYIRQVDRPPRQVLIEAHVMSIELKDDAKHGLNLEYLDEIGLPSVTVKTQGFADLAAFNQGVAPAFFFNLAASDLNVLLEALETSTDAKTLANPKVLALSGQEARIQIGQQLGFRVTTTTQTSTLESVDFLDVGVVLVVTPWITRDNQVMMHVKPEVSSGEINTKTELPEEETTEVETSLMLPDGHGMVIGGLIQELDSETQEKIPLIGDLWLIGRLFQKRVMERRRNEIIIALIPHIVPYQPIRQQRECQQFYRATTPLLYGPLMQTPRPEEPRFPDAGQRLSPRYNLSRLGTIPDRGLWPVPAGEDPCLPGVQRVPPVWQDGMPFPEGIPAYGNVPQPAEVIPTPLPRAPQ